MIRFGGHDHGWWVQTVKLGISSLICWFTFNSTSGINFSSINQEHPGQFLFITYSLLILPRINTLGSSTYSQNEETLHCNWIMQLPYWECVEPLPVKWAESQTEGESLRIHLQQISTWIPQCWSAHCYGQKKEERERQWSMIYSSKSLCMETSITCILFWHSLSNETNKWSRIRGWYP